MRDLFAGLFLSRFSPDARRGWAVTLVLTAVLAAATVALTRPHVSGAAPQLRPNDDHSVRSVELATNWIVCGKYSIAFQGDSFGVFLAMAPDSQELRLRDLPASIAGSTDRYCRLAEQPWRNNENSLMLAIAAILAFRPDATLADAGYALRWIRIALVIGVAFVMLRCGLSFWLTLGVAYASIIVMAAVEETRFYSVYPFLPVLLTGFIAMLVLLLDLRLHASLRRAAAAAFVAGVAAAIAANFRSSYLPILGACFLLWIALGELQKKRELAGARMGMLRRAGAEVLVFALGFTAFQFVFIRPIDRLPSSRNISYHVIAHPIVLALALPPNRLARDEGIEWNDRVGLDLARRVDPGVTEINQRYEAALFTYYRQLWRQHPRQMAGLYWAKLRLAGSDIPTYSAQPVSGWFASIALWPWSLVSHGAFRAVILGILTLAPVFMVRRWGAVSAAIVSMTAATALLLTIETALILTFFYISHEASAMLFAIATGLLVYQAVVDGLAVAARRIRQPGKTWRATGAPAP